MTNEEAIDIINNRLNTYYCTEEDLQALDLAIQALKTGEVYMTGEDYNLYMEEYKVGKRDFSPKQGEWIVTAEDNDGVHRICCPFCYFETGSNNDAPIVVTYEKLPNFCENCGADMRDDTK